jgi:hypothetical protein
VTTPTTSTPALTSNEIVSDDTERITGHRPRDVESYLGETLGDLNDQAAR